MPQDSINEEILAIKRSLSAAFDNDISRIAEDIRSREKDVVLMRHGMSSLKPSTPAEVSDMRISDEGREAPNR
jgi:hypothetical protein